MLRMATFRISEAEAARDFAAVLARVREGAEVIIENESSAVAVVVPPNRRPGRTLSEIIARLDKRGSLIVPDAEFARDVEETVRSHPEPLDPPEWD